MKTIKTTGSNTIKKTKSTMKATKKVIGEIGSEIVDEINEVSAKNKHGNLCLQQ